MYFGSLHLTKNACPQASCAIAINARSRGIKKLEKKKKSLSTDPIFFGLMSQLWPDGTQAMIVV